MRNGDNLGIAAALNIGVRHALAAGYEWIATFDQDSTVPAGYIGTMLNVLEGVPCQASVALLCPRYRDRNTGVISSYGKRGTQELYLEVQTTMTSGNLVRAAVFGQVGFFDESFFMDCVDHEFCLRLRRHGCRVIEVQDAVLEHSLGSMALHSLLGKQCKVYNHPPLRRYYNVRNRVVIYGRYIRIFPAWVIRDLCNLGRELAGVILFEPCKGAKLAAVCRGAYDGIAGRTGRVV